MDMVCTNCCDCDMFSLTRLRFKASHACVSDALENIALLFKIFRFVEAPKKEPQSHFRSNCTVLSFHFQANSKSLLAVKCFFSNALLVGKYQKTLFEDLLVLTNFVSIRRRRTYSCSVVDGDYTFPKLFFTEIDKRVKDSYVHRICSGYSSLQFE